MIINSNADHKTSDYIALLYFGLMYLHLYIANGSDLKVTNVFNITKPPAPPLPYA